MPPPPSVNQPPSAAHSASTGTTPNPLIAHPTPAILAPAGNWETLNAALHAGADAIYFGVGKLNMRAHAARNFTVADLPEIVRACGPVKTHLTVNTIVYDDELDEIRKILLAARDAGVSAIIAHDLSVIQYAHSLGLPLHISTQANVSNTESLRFYARWASVVVLARELTAHQIRRIADTIRHEQITGPDGRLLRLEVFIHGALCIAISGKCHMSLAQYNTSANRGACYQTCRRSYRVTDTETGNELEIDNEYVMSPSDLCTVGFLDQLLQTGASILKIEGRGRPPEYVATTVSVYREALRAIEEGHYTIEAIQEWEERLARVFNRGFWQGGYYMGRKIDEWAASHGSQATRRKEYVGKVINYYPKAGVVQVPNQFRDGDTYLITGPTTGAVEGEVAASRPENDTLTFKTPRVRINDQVYKLTPCER